MINVRQVLKGLKDGTIARTFNSGIIVTVNIHRCLIGIKVYISSTNLFTFEIEEAVVLSSGIGCGSVRRIALFAFRVFNVVWQYNILMCSVICVITVWLKLCKVRDLLFPAGVYFLCVWVYVCMIMFLSVEFNYAGQYKHSFLSRITKVNKELKLNISTDASDLLLTCPFVSR